MQECEIPYFCLDKFIEMASYMLYASLVIIIRVVYDLIVTRPHCELFNLRLDTIS